MERQYKADIIIMRQEENGKYRFYMIDKQNEMKATEKEIEELSSRHNAKISWFPTQEPAIASLRKLLTNN